MLLGTRPLGVAMIAALLLVITACGRASPPEASAVLTPTATPSATPKPSPTPLPPPTPTPINPEVTIKQSGQVMEGLKYFHFHLYHENGGMELLPGLVIEDVSGDVVNPDRLSVAFTGKYSKGYAVRASLITLGNDSYMTNPLTGQWEAWDTGVSPLGFFSPAKGIKSMIARLAQVYQIKDEGQKPEVYRFGGVLATEALSPLVGATVEGAVVRVELTIDANDLYLLQAKIAGRVTPTDIESVVRVITLSAFNEPVAIEAPL